MEDGRLVLRAVLFAERGARHARVEEEGAVDRAAELGARAAARLLQALEGGAWPPGR